MFYSVILIWWALTSPILGYHAIYIQLLSVLFIRINLHCMGFTLTKNADKARNVKKQAQRYAVGQFLIFRAIGVICEAKASMEI